MADEELPSVCVVTQPLSSAGESATRGLLEILASLTAVSLVTPSVPEGSDLRERYEVVTLSGVGTGAGVVVPAVRFAGNQFRMARTVWRREEELILFFGATSYLLPILVAKLAGKIVVVEPRGDVPLTLRLYWERRLPGAIARGLAGIVWGFERVGFWVADAIIVYTPGVADQLELGRFSEKVYTEGARYVDTDVFYPRVPFEEREQVVGFLGRLDEEKGIRTLAEVAKRLPDDVTFRFVGDGDLRGWLEAELREEVAAGQVELVGWVDHERVPEELSRMRLLVMPSEPTEGLPTVILEAMACGTPVYATPVSGVPDVVRDGETGFQLTAADRTVIAEGISSIMAGADLSSVSDAAGKLVDEEFSFGAAVDRYERIVLDIVG